MAKKSRRTRNTPRLSSAQLAGAADVQLPRAEQAAQAAQVAQAAPRRRSGEGGRAPVREDYTYVISDLKRIAVLAGSLFVIMIVLSFILPQIIR